MSADSPTRDRPYSRKEVVEILHAAVARMGADEDTGLQAQLTDLARYMESLRHELAQLRSIEISHNHLPAASDELDAIVGETATATGRIMDACDRLQAHVTLAPPELRDRVNADVTAIFEACSFQDITGQRITKVVKTLKNIEKKVEDIRQALGHHASETSAAPAAAEAAPTGDAALLNGPQLGGPAISQDEIDKLLASFD